MSWLFSNLLIGLFVCRQGHWASDEHACLSRHARRPVRTLRQSLLGGRLQGAPQGQKDLQGHHPTTD